MDHKGLKAAHRWLKKDRALQTIQHGWKYDAVEDSNLGDIVEAHCYFVDIGRIDREQIRSRINNNDCRTFRPRRPLSTAYRTKVTAV